MELKKCARCKIVKPLSDFYLHNKAYCKDCNKARSKESIKKALEKDPDLHVKRGIRIKEAGQKYKNKNASASTIKQREKFPEKAAAVDATRGTVRIPGVDMHHWSYNEEHWTDIILMPRTLHRMGHRFLIYDQPAKMFRTPSGELLDTKEKHDKFLKGIIKERVLPLLKKNHLKTA